MIRYSTATLIVAGALLVYWFLMALIAAASGGRGADRNASGCFHPANRRVCRH